MQLIVQVKIIQSYKRKFQHQEDIPRQLLFKGVRHVINVTKVLQTQPQMAGHVHYNKEKYISIVDLVISPSDHIQAQKIFQ